MTEDPGGMTQHILSSHQAARKHVKAAQQSPRALELMAVLKTWEGGVSTDLIRQRLRGISEPCSYEAGFHLTLN